jgi:hypothetical protein
VLQRRNTQKGETMGNVIVKLLLANLSQRVVVTLLIAVVERAQGAALETATPVDDAIVGAVLDVLRSVEAGVERAQGAALATATPVDDSIAGAVLDVLRRVDAEAGQ